MSGKDHRDNTRVPVALRIKLRFRNVDTFISKFATNISSTGMFISSRLPRKAGTQLRFELRLADDSTVIAGKGRVVWVREYDANQPKEPHGMGIEFVSLSQGSRELILLIVQQRVQQGLAENTSIPFSLESLENTAADVAAPPTPLVEAVEANKVATQHRSPRWADSSDLTLEKLDDAKIDLSAVLQRARALVGKGQSDLELDALFRVSAAPIAETVDDASNKLAQILGGAAVQGMRGRHRDPATDHTALADILPDDIPTPTSTEGPPTQVAYMEEKRTASPRDSDRLARADSEDGISIEEEDIEEEDIEEGREVVHGAAIGQDTESAEHDDSITDVGEDPTSFSGQAFDAEDDMGDFRDLSVDQPTALSTGRNSGLAIDSAHHALGHKPPRALKPSLNSALASLDDEND